MFMNEKSRPGVGIGVLVKNGDKILLGERISAHGAGTFQIPGGHLEFGESFEECAVREAKEESGVTSRAVKVISVSNDISYEKHYVSIGVLTEYVEGEARDAEPEHSKNWQWVDPHNLPENMFPHSKKIIENWLSGNIYNP